MSNSKPLASLPRLILLADRFTSPARAARVCEAVACGVRWVHLRDHEADNSTFASAAATLTEQLQGLSSDVLISINGRPEIASALGVNYHGGMERPGNSHGLVGYSAHTLEEVEAQGSMVDYLFYSPIYPTTSKPGHPGIGLQALADATQLAASVPVYALGGIKPAHCSGCLEAGAHGVAVISGVLQADDIADAVQAYLTELEAKTK